MNPISLTDSILKIFFITAILILRYTISFAQSENPQQSITISATQAIHFGSFCITGNSGGSITVSYDGNRTSTGDIVLLPSMPEATPAIFEAKFCPGKNVSINYDASISLQGSNGTVLKMDIGPTEKGPNGYTFTTTNDCNAITSLRVGGTLHIPRNSLSGNYSSLFNITFKLE